MIGKQVINVIQMVKASKWLAEGDVARRMAAAVKEAGKKKF